MSTAIKSKKDLQTAWANSQTDEVFKFLLEIADQKGDSNLKNEIIVLTRNYRENEKARDFTIDRTVYQIQYNQISLRTLTTIESIPDDYFTKLPATDQLPEDWNKTVISEINIRLHLNGLMQDMVNLLHEETELNTQDPLYTIKSGNFREKKVLITSQVLWIIERIPHLLSPMEYNIIGRALFASQDYRKSEEYYKKAIDYADSSSILIANVRSYASFLYFVGRRLEGAKQYNSALLSEEDTDENKSTNGWTYQMQFRDEARFSSDDFTEPKKIYIAAKTVYESINSAQNREFWLKGLFEDWGRFMPFNIPRP